MPDAASSAVRRPEQLGCFKIGAGVFFDVVLRRVGCVQVGWRCVALWKSEVLNCCIEAGQLSECPFPPVALVDCKGLQEGERGAIGG